MNDLTLNNFMCTRFSPHKISLTVAWFWSTTIPVKFINVYGPYRRVPWPMTTWVQPQRKPKLYWWWTRTTCRLGSSNGNWVWGLYNNWFTLLKKNRVDVKIKRRTWKKHISKVRNRTSYYSQSWYEKTSQSFFQQQKKKKRRLYINHESQKPH